MLPDYPKLKSQLKQRLDEWLASRVRLHSGPIADIRETRIFEGRSTAMIQAGKNERQRPFRRGEAGFEVNPQEVPELTLDKVLAQLDRVARELANQKMDFFFSTLSEAANSVGNVVQATEGLTPDALFDLFEKIQLEFDEDGQISGLRAVLGPKQFEQMEQTKRQIENDPELKDRFDELLARKRADWRVREASRNLVG